MVPTENFAKGDETTGQFARFKSLIIPHKRLLMEIFLASILYTLMGLAGAFYFKFLIDEVLAEGLQRTLHIISTGMLVDVRVVVRKQKIIYLVLEKLNFHKRFNQIS